jgi:hypothetical protein
VTGVTGWSKKKKKKKKKTNKNKKINKKKIRRSFKLRGQNQIGQNGSERY